MSDKLKNKISGLSTGPGVYLMKGDKDKVIYIGKAKNLRSRVRQYFNKDADGRYQIKFLMKRVQDIDVLLCRNEKEALLLENSLIKKHKPRYNIFLKDDKSYVSLKLNINHSFPKLEMTRRLKKDGSLYFGPYASAEACRETVQFLQENFQLRTCTDHDFSNRSRPCLEYQIKRCTAPCVDYVSKESYMENQWEPVKLFLEGKNKELIKTIKEKMIISSKQENFEKAAYYRDLLHKIEVTLEKQEVVKHGGLHQDLITLYREDNKGMVAVFNIREGSLIDSHYYPIRAFESDEILLGQFLSQYYLDHDFIPDEILVYPTLFSDNELRDLLSEKKGKKLILRSPQKGEKKRLIDLAYYNAKSHFIKNLRREKGKQEILRSLQEKLNLKNYPKRMECYDISNISGQLAYGSQVVFIEGEKSKKDYRLFKIRGIEGPNDYEMMKQVLLRRLAHLKEDEPKLDCVVLDGGKGQLNIILAVAEELNLKNIDFIAISKGSGRGARAKGLWDNKKEEEIFIANRKNSIVLKRGSHELMLLQNIRDEAHRFAITSHRKSRDKKLKQSFLDSVPGIGPKKKEALYKKFKSKKEILNSSKEELMSINGISEGLANLILEKVSK